MPVGSAVAAALPLGPELNSTSSANRCARYRWSERAMTRPDGSAANRRTSSSASPAATPSRSASSALARPAVTTWRTVATRWPCRVSVSQMPGRVAASRLTGPDRSPGTHSRTTSRPSPSTVRSERAYRTSAPSSTPREPASERGAGRYPNSTTRRSMVLPASATAEAACRNEPMASRWWKAAPGDEPPGAVPRVDQALVSEHLESASYRRTGDLVAVAELRLGVERADVAELAERDALAEVVGDGGEPGTCH